MWLRERCFGYIISAVGTNKYLVQFDKGHASSLLKKERMAASAPLVILIPVGQQWMRMQMTILILKIKRRRSTY
jgi:hypothetical protein